MTSSIRSLTYTRVGCSLTVAACLVLPLALRAAPIPKNLGNGLAKLVESNLAVKGVSAKGYDNAGFVNVDGRVYSDAQAANYAGLAIADETQERILVRVNPDGRVPLDSLLADLKSNLGSFEATAVDPSYHRTGVLNAFISIDDVPALATTEGVRSVILEIRPRVSAVSSGRQLENKKGTDGSATNVFNKLGTAFDQGVTQHHVTDINRFYNPNAALDYEGNGMTIACISDSYNRFTTAGRTAPVGVANFDLPGDPANPINTKPVVVLEDYNSAGTDEGRAMCEIVYKMAPKARVGFATAFLGTVDFGNNIRALAGLPGYTKDPSIQQGFAADVICDDVSYEDEPLFQDGIIARAVNDVAAAGVSYFSSAGNNTPIGAYYSDFRPVPNGNGLSAAQGNSALQNTNINLANVPADLYAGGFHNFNASGLDVAQTVNIPNGNSTSLAFEWDDPYDQPLPDSLLTDPTPIYSNTGNIPTTATSVTFNDLPNLTAGQEYVFKQKVLSGNLDPQISVLDSTGRLVAFQDTSTEETLQFYCPATDHYTVRVTQRGNTGTFSLNVFTAHDTPAGVSTDFNLLVFDMNGNYLPNNTMATNNIATNEAVEFGVVTRATGQTQVQFVIARSNVPAVPTPASHLRYVFNGNGAGGLGPAEYFSYTSITMGGHNSAAGANGVAAYSVFRPSIPESFTSPGPVPVYFDPSGNRLATPDIRLQPAIAAADAANNSFFSSDSGNDPDTTSRNFSGTSAAAPHAAAIALLALEAHGGPRSISASSMTRLLQRSTFAHDLDPYFVSGTARSNTGGKINIALSNDSDSNAGTGSNDTNAFSIAYVGPGALTSVTFNPEGTAATAGNPTGGNNGVTYSTTGVGGTVTYFENSFPGMVFSGATPTPAVGSGSTIAAANVMGAFSHPAGSPSTTQSYTWSLTFTGNTFTGGNILRFNTPRAIQHSAATNNAPPYTGATSNNSIADLLGGGVSLPSGTVTTDGMTFSGTTSDGGTFSGTLKNRIGNGYSALDGFGFINAQSAVLQPTP